MIALGQTRKSHRGASARHAGAFTLLEVILAASIGMMVIIGAIALMLTYQRTDIRLARRYEQVTDLQRIRLVMDRSCSTFLMSMSSRASTPTATAETGTTEAAASKAGAANNTASGAGATAETNSKFGATASAATSGGTAGKTSDGKAAASNGADASSAVGRPARRQVPPRISLGPGAEMPLALLRAIPNRPTTDSRPEGGRESRRAMLTPQRLELVLSASPVPQTEDLRSQIRRRTRENTTGRSMFDAPANPNTGAPAGTLSDEADEEPVRAIRGVFELHPQLRKDTGAGSVMPDALSSGAPLWELWWVPLPPRGDDPIDTTDARSVEAAQRERQQAAIAGGAGQPYKVAGNIAFLEWKMFQGRTRRTAYEAAYWSDLPAYVEMEVETADGLTGNWLFEVSADQGLEVAPEDAPVSGNLINAKTSVSGGAAAKGSTSTGMTALTPAQPITGKSGAGSSGKGGGE